MIPEGGRNNSLFWVILPVDETAWEKEKLTNSPYLSYK